MIQSDKILFVIQNKFGIIERLFGHKKQYIILTSIS